MLEWARLRLTYANVVATVALFGVLAGGVAVAATVAKDSVGKKQLKDQSVIGKKIADGTVKSGKLADGSVTTPKLADGAVTGAKADESTFGTVPSAQQATQAQNSVALGGAPLAGVRSAATGASEGTDVPIAAAPTTVISQNIDVPAGGGTVTGTASIDVFTSDITARVMTCTMEAGRGGTFAAISELAFANFPGTPGTNIQVPVVGLKASVPAGTETVRIRCEESSGTALTFDRGNLVVEVHPTG